MEKEGRIMGLAGILWTIVLVLVVLWILGFALHIAGGLVHLLLIVAAILVVYNLVTRSRAPRTY
jgi:Family of unknown function (DUF5670)